MGELFNVLVDGVQIANNSSQNINNSSEKENSLKRSISVANANDKQFVTKESFSPAKKRWLKSTQWISRIAKQGHQGFVDSQKCVIDTLISSPNDIAKVLVKAREQFISLLDAEHCILYLATYEENLAFDGQSIYSSNPHQKGIVSRVLSSRKTVYIPDVCMSNEFDSELDAVAGVEIKSYLCIPLVDDNGVAAVAEIVNSRKDQAAINAWLNLSINGELITFSAFVGRVVRSLAGNFTSTSIITRIKHSFDDSKDLINPEFVEEYSTGLKTQEALKNAVLLFQAMIKADRCTVYVVDNESDLVWSKLAYNNQQVVMKIGQGIAGTVAKTGEIINLVNVYNDKRFCKEFDEKSGYLTGSMLCVPAFGPEGKTIVGVVQMMNKCNKSSFDEADVSLCKNLCRHVGNAMHNAKLHEAVIRAEGKAQTLLNLSAVLFKNLECHALLLSIMETVKVPFSAGICSIFVVDEKRQELWSPVGSELGEREIRIPLTAGIVGAVVKSGKIINIQDAYDDPRFNKDIDCITGKRTKSILAFPIKDVHGQVIGVMEVINKISKGFFDSDDVDLGTGIVYYLAIALNNSRLFESARKAKRRSDALLTLLQVISSCTEVDDVFDSVVSTTCQILNAKHGALFIIDMLNKVFFCKTGTNSKAFKVSLTKGIPGMVLKTKEIVNVDDASSHASYDHSYDEHINDTSTSCLCIPVKSKDKIIAVFQVVNKLGRSSFTNDDIKILTAISNEISSIIERKSLEVAFRAETMGDVEEITGSFLSEYTTSLPYNNSPCLTSYDSNAYGRYGNKYPSSTYSSSMTASQPVIEVNRLPVRRLSKVKDILTNWNLDPWDYEYNQLEEFSFDIFQSCNLLSTFEIPVDTLTKFIASVRGQYNDLPYHNFVHAFTTLHISFLIMNTQKLEHFKNNCINYLDEEDMLAICIASYCHDMKHNGRTNDFHIQSRSVTAMMYNDQSVQENLHAATCFETMQRPGNNVLQNLSKETFHRIRKSIVNAILSTDMHKHNTLVTNLHSRLKQDVFRKENENDKELLISAIVHSADISNPTMPVELSKKWANLILLEFNSQYEEEERRGLSPTSYMSAKKGSAEQAQLNIAFIDSCVFPLWNTMNDFFYGLDNCMENITKNREMWVVQRDQKKENDATH